MAMQSPATTTISDVQRAQFTDQGFLFLPQFLESREVLALGQVIERHVRAYQKELSDSNTQGVSRAGEISFTQHLAEQDEVVARFVRHERLVGLAISLLGPDIELYWDQAVYKLPDTAREFPWHQDNGYTPVEPEQYLTVWIALGEVTIENGGLWILPGSHTRGVRPHLDTPIGKAADVGGARGIPVEARPGDVLAFSSLLLHKSGPNLSRGERRAYIVQYAPQGVRDKVTKKPVGRGAVASGGLIIEPASVERAQRESVGG
jgi:ectoine hydroxylase-related dioxygenase (phytanoyl-CoA dioxygenase family)